MSEKKISRGFITIATGNKHYSKIAANLLLSYRLFAKEPLPFAVIAEERNQYTELFDDVILTTESTHSFLDKFLLLKLCPYDETIFIDADSLAYGDLNEYWDFFKNATDFSATGVNVPLSQQDNVWYNVEDIGEYGSRITYKTRVHAGVCFIRKSDHLHQLYNDCMDIYKNYDKLIFHTCPNSVDECVLGIAMPMNQMRAIREKAHMLAAYPCLTRLHADILHGKLSYCTPWDGYTEQGILLHWGTSQTFQPLYRFNAECLQYMYRNRNCDTYMWDKIKYRLKLRLYILTVSYYISSTAKLAIKIIRKLWRLICKS